MKRPHVHHHVLLVLSIVAPPAWLACGDDAASNPNPDATDSAETSNPTTTDATGDASGDTTPGAGDTTADTASEDPVFASLLGDWVIPCKPAPGGGYALSRLHVTPDAVENTYTQHGDPSCSESSVRVKFVVVDSVWDIGEPFGEGLALDMVLEKSAVTISDPGTLNAWNSGSGCGPFTLGAEKDVAGMTCYGFWRPARGETYYAIIEVSEDTFLFGSPASGDMKSEATRSTALDRANVWQRVGASTGGFIEGTIGGETYRAEQNLAARLVPNDHIQLGATTAALAPWESWIVNVPNAVGTYLCDDESFNTYIDFGFTQDNLPVLWDSEQDGADGCTIEVTKAATAVGETIEGSFSGTLGDGDGTGHAVSAGSFQVVRSE